MSLELEVYIRTECFRLTPYQLDTVFVVELMAFNRTNVDTGVEEYVVSVCGTDKGMIYTASSEQDARDMFSKLIFNVKLVDVAVLTDFGFVWM